jgi:putative endonuclease
MVASQSQISGENDSMAWVYVLECAKEVLYVGSTRDLDARMDQHTTGRIGFTSRRRPLKLLWCLEFGDISEAYAAERRLHGWSRAKKLALAAGDTELLRELSQRRTRSGDSDNKTPEPPS